MSSSEPPKKPDSYRRSRTLKRGCSFEPVNADHFRWLWAAYGTGSFPEDGRFPPGLTATEFRDEAALMLRELIQDGNDAFVLMNQGGKPVGLVTVWAKHLKHEQPQFFPHVNWFTWATPRNKLECALDFLIEMKKEAFGILIIEPENWRFFGHLCKYGVLRRVGTFRGYWADGRDAAVFETVR